MPPIRAAASSVSESCVGKPKAVGWPSCAASSAPATPVVNDASANAQSL